MRRAVAALALAGCLCIRGHEVPMPAPPRSVFAADYDDPAMWLCRPDQPTDACRGDLDATELGPDGSREVVPFVPAATPAVDCFYVYPTVDPSMIPGNHVDFSDTSIMREVTQFQIARFGSVCRLVVPLYRQVTIATYLASRQERDERLGAAFDDVFDAFRWYREHLDEGLPIVLLGHSQGAEMVLRLLGAIFDDDPVLRARLLVAMAIGARVSVPERGPPELAFRGGRLRHIPLCTSADELGCVVAFDSFGAEGSPAPWVGRPPAGRRIACVNPADVGGQGRRLLSGAVFPTRSRIAGDLAASRWAKTPFLELRDFYAASCIDGADGFRYLGVEPAPGPGDRRTSPVDLDSPMWRTPLGLHVLDYQFVQRDLVDLVVHKAQVAASR
jgi:fermentation-respiration switch protein FrsA (DUF1100 family)